MHIFFVIWFLLGISQHHSPSFCHFFFLIFLSNFLSCHVSEKKIKSPINMLLQNTEYLERYLSSISIESVFRIMTKNYYLSILVCGRKHIIHMCCVKQRHNTLKEFFCIFLSTSCDFIFYFIFIVFCVFSQ